MHSFDKDIIDDIQRLLDRPVVLIGMMGAGKTRIGRQISKAIGIDFVDSDDEIEQAAGMDIPEIFDRFGEEYFRAGEKRVIERLMAQGTGVLATGGGAIMTSEVAQLIWDKGISIWIRAEIDVMVERTSRKDKRPLLKTGDPKEIISNLADQRYPVYEKANIVVDSHNGPSEAILNQAIEKLHYFLSHDQRKTG